MELVLALSTLKKLTQDVNGAQKNYWEFEF